MISQLAPGGGFGCGGAAGELAPGAAGEGVAARGVRVAVLRRVGDDEDVGIRGAPLDLLPRRASFGAAATVVTPRIRRALDRLLTVFPPRPHVGAQPVFLHLFNYPFYLILPGK